jgi:hypothetical protein
MGTWLNLALIQSADTKQVEQELSRLLTEGGRRLTIPEPRTPELYDRMQYGLGDEVQRWGVAGFPGAPGWTVLRSAPFELLMQGTPPLLARLAARLGVPAFQYNLYDSTSGFLMEVDADGRVELSGFVGHDVSRYWNGEPPESRIEVRFRIINPSSVAAWSESAMPDARVSGWLPSAGTNGRVHPAHVVRRLAHVGGAGLPTVGCVDEAIMTVFGGPNAKHCDNLFLVETLVPHSPMPVEGFVLYAELGKHESR